jgi:hypothetical protein
VGLRYDVSEEAAHLPEALKEIMFFDDSRMD